MWEPIQDKTSGLSILDMSTWQIEHVVFEKDPEERQYWKAYGTYLEGDDLYMAFYNAKFNGKTYYGVYDTLTGEMEAHEIPGISQFLIFVEKDGDNLYFSTVDDWLIKYTLE